jgi:lipopolysaccharide biosynthesis glycosyltransferase
MSAELPQPYGLVTITDRDFVVGTEVLLYSFLKYNPWFAGDLIVIEQGLPEDHRDRLQRLAPMRLVRPDPRLEDRTRALRARLPGLDGIYKRFCSFEVFRLAGYRRVVYLDSDICCVGDVSALFAADAPLCACPDGFTYGDRIRAALAEDEGRKTTPTVRYGRPFEASFNAGVISVGPELLGEETYGGLLDLLDYDAWRALGASKFTDQMALNVHFEGRFAPLEAVYNYMIFLEGYQRCWERVGFADARLLHFAGTIKPWHDYDPHELVERAPQFIKFIDVWRELLQEARAGDRTADMAAAYRRQKSWIEAYNAAPLTPRGRIS